MKRVDYLIVGSGLAGLYTAYKASARGSVMVVTKKAIRDSNSYHAQGGIAAATTIEDNPDLHFIDTVIAGRGLCEDDAVRILVNEGPERIAELIEDGMKFDTENGKLALGLEGGHNRKRILHAGGDSTGKVITEFLISKVSSDESITLRDNLSVIDLLIKDNVCYGVRCWNDDTNQEEMVYANYVFLSSGGASAVYRRTTNPKTTVGDGLAMAYNAGCRIVDIEFIQFHPSSLYIDGSRDTFLVSEAVRGEGAHLLNKDGKRFMLSIHELAELAPRDIVARSIFKEMADDDRPFVELSLGHLDPDKVKTRFPNIYAKCVGYGYDMTDKLPIAPAAHYTVGGIASDYNGRSDIDRLYVCGEVASTGIMGANRLASNSLLECLVFADRAIKDSLGFVEQDDCPIFEPKYSRDENNKERYLLLMDQVSEILNNCSGIVRSETLLATGLSMIKKEIAKLDMNSNEYYNDASSKLLTVAWLIMTSARYRRESRGGHYREDYPNTRDNFAVHTVQKKGEKLSTLPVNNEIK